MIADPNTSFEPHSSEQLPASKRVYLSGALHADVRVPMREIDCVADEVLHRRDHAERSRARL